MPTVKASSSIITVVDVTYGFNMGIYIKRYVKYEK